MIFGLPGRPAETAVGELAAVGVSGLAGASVGMAVGGVVGPGVLVAGAEELQLARKKKSTVSVTTLFMGHLAFLPGGSTCTHCSRPPRNLKTAHSIIDSVAEMALVPQMMASQGGVVKANLPSTAAI
jgi:hypothetical protein